MRETKIVIEVKDDDFHLEMEGNLGDDEISYVLLHAYLTFADELIKKHNCGDETCPVVRITKEMVASIVSTMNTQKLNLTGK